MTKALVLGGVSVNTIIYLDKFPSRAANSLQ
jgi:hypothetical protein